MAAKKRLSLEQEEVLAFNVKKFPCLFNKKDKSYKEKDCIFNAWTEVCNLTEFVESGKSFCFSTIHQGPRHREASYDQKVF